MLSNTSKQREGFTQWAKLFLLVGLVFIAWAMIVATAFPNPDLGARIKSYNGSFTEAHLIACLGVGKILIGTFYWLTPRIQLGAIAGTQKWHFLASLWLPLLICLMPVLEKYVPTSVVQGGGAGIAVAAFLTIVMLYIFGIFFFLIRLGGAILNTLRKS